MVSVVEGQIGVDFWQGIALEETLALTEKYDVKITGATGVEHVISELLETFVKGTLIQSTFACGRPVEILSLMKKNPEDPRLAGRFGLFIMGREFADAFTELNDSIGQRGRFEAQGKGRELENDEAHGVGENFLEALEYDMSPTNGLSIGIDELVVLLADTQSIRDALPFPTMK